MGLATGLYAIYSKAERAHLYLALLLLMQGIFGFLLALAIGLRANILPACLVMMIFFILLNLKKKGTKYQNIFKNYINTIPNTRY